MSVLPELEQLGYSDTSVLGQGGFGTVYGAFESEFGRRVAIKVIETRLDSDAERRFDRERRAVAALPAHPHIVTVYAISRTPSGLPFFVMELVDGGSLRDRAGQLSWAEAFRLGVQLAGALETAHRAGVIHRDVKPDNILFGSYGEAKLTDFGIATLTSGGSTTTAAVTATISHAAPEILSGGPAGPPCDIYSLASTLHTLVAGAPPFPPGAGGLPELITRIATAAPPSLVDFGVPAAAADVVLSALAKDPADRPQTAEEFGQLLSDALAGAGETAPQMAIAAPVDRPAGSLDAQLTGSATVAGRRGPAPVPVVEPAPERRNRRTIVVAAVATAAVVAAGTGVVVAKPWDSGGARTTAAAAPASASASASPATATRTHKSAAKDTTGGKDSGGGGSHHRPGGSTGGGDTTSGGGSDTTSGGGGADTGTNDTHSPTSNKTDSSSTTKTSNAAPTLAAVPNQSTSELKSVSLRMAGRDADGDRLVYSVSGLPSGLSVSSSTGLISGTVRATAANATTDYRTIKSVTLHLTARVTDGDKTASRSFSWTIRDSALVMPNYFNAYGCGDECSPASPTDRGKLNTNHIGPKGSSCTNTKPDGITDRDKIVAQSVPAGRSITWGTYITYTYYPCT